MRDSNLELARIVAMAMIVAGHFVFHGVWRGWPGPVDSFGVLGASEYLLCFLCFLFNAGMNVFVLISGYYGIRLRWKNLISFWLLCVFYNALNLIANGGMGVIDIASIFLISKSGHWFLKAYFLLMLLSPLLNAAMDNLDIKHLRIAIGCVLVLCCVSGWALNNGTSNGMNALQLVCIYLIGGWVRRDDITLKVKGIQAVTGYLCCAILNMIGLVIIYYGLRKEIGILYQHNNPLVVAESFFLFSWFRGLSFKSKFVNIWASTMIGVLLLGDMVCYNYIYNFIHNVNQNGEMPLVLALLVLFVIVFAMGFVVEFLRKLTFDPVAKWLSSRLPPLFDN